MLRHEDITGDRSHGRENATVGNVPRGQLAPHHLPEVRVLLPKHVGLDTVASLRPPPLPTTQTATRSAHHIPMVLGNRTTASLMTTAAISESATYCGHSAAMPSPLRKIARTISRKCRTGLRIVIH